MKAKIDGELCTGHGRCCAVAPEFYQLDDNGYNADRGKTLDVPAGMQAAARLGVAEGTLSSRLARGRAGVHPGLRGSQRRKPVPHPGTAEDLARRRAGYATKAVRDGMANHVGCPGGLQDNCAVLFEKKRTD